MTGFIVAGRPLGHWLDLGYRFLPLALIAAGIGVLATAYFFQYVLGLAPCILCLLQRWPYVLAIALGGLAYALPAARPAVYFWAAATFAVGTGIAVFHVGVEQHWWLGTSACGGAAFAQGLSARDMVADLLATPPVACDQVPWDLFGISMAGFNVALSLGLTGIAAWAFRRSLRPGA